MFFDEKIRGLLAETKLSLHPDSFSIVGIARSEDNKVRGIITDLDSFASLTSDFAARAG